MLDDAAAETAHDVIGHLIHAGSDYADIFIEEANLGTLRMHGERPEEVGSGLRRGAGIRLVRAGRQYLAHTNDLTPAGLVRAATSLVGIVDRDASPPVLPTGRARASIPTEVSIDHHQAFEIARAAYEGARSSADVDSVKIDIETSTRRIWIINSQGQDLGRNDTRVELTVDCSLQSSGGLDNGRRNRGNQGTLDDFALEDAAELGRRAGQLALSRASSVPAPVGTYDVVAAPGTAGVIFHETVGHGLEVDLVESFRSVYHGCVDQQIASELLTVSDDGRRAGGWGSAAFDDEAVPTGRTDLVRDGVLCGYLYDRASIGRHGGTLTGNGRRATYTDLPYVRMTNTVVQPGDDDPDDIIASTKRGIYVSLLRGGGFNPGTGDFLFSTAEARLIEDGRLTAPVTNASIVGSAREALLRVDAVGTDFEMVAGGRCGKRSQTLPVGFGSPTIRLRGMTIGGH